MSTNEFQGQLYGLPITLRQHRGLVDDLPPTMRDRNKRKVAGGLTRHESAVRNRQLSGVKKTTEMLKQQQESIQAALDQAEDDIEQINDGVRTGEIDPDAAEQVIKQIIIDLGQHRDARQRIEASINRAREVADTDPADWQIENLERFPVLKTRLPVLTEDWLFGDDNRDPFGGE